MHAYTQKTTDIFCYEKDAEKFSTHDCSMAVPGNVTICYFLSDCVLRKPRYLQSFAHISRQKECGFGGSRALHL